MQICRRISKHDIANVTKWFSLFHFAAVHSLRSLPLIAAVRGSLAYTQGGATVASSFSSLID